MQSKVIYRYTAEPRKDGNFYISIARGRSVPNDMMPTKVVPARLMMSPAQSESDNNVETATKILPAKESNVGNAFRLSETAPSVEGEIALIESKGAAGSHSEKNQLTEKVKSNELGVTNQGQKEISGLSTLENIDIYDSAIDFRTNVMQTIKEEGLLKGSHPIRLDATTDAAERDPTRRSFVLGELVISDASSDSAEVVVTERTHNEAFYITYVRPAFPLATGETGEMRPDDAAMIVRAFMLAKLATARLDVRDILKTQTRLTTKLQQANTSEQYRISSINRMLVLLRQLKAEEAEEAEEKGSHHPDNKKDTYAHVMASPALLAMENSMARFAQSFHDKVHRQKSLLYLAMFIALAIVLFWVWIPYRFHSIPLTAWSWLGTILVALCLAGGVVFLLYALNLKQLRHHIEETLYKRSTDRLHETMAELVQANANVAVVNLSPEPQDGPVSELLLCKMDQNLHLKERLTSIESVIKARAAYLSANAQHIEKHRDRVRRSITAAGSGVFVGFFTYEVGESLMSYLHVAHHQDPNAMLYWLIANIDRIKVKDGHAEVLPAPDHASATHQETIAAPHTVQHGHEIDAAFLATYHQPELYAHSWLLTLTIVFSVITAWIAIRKPEAEQSGGHGHH